MSDNPAAVDNYENEDVIMMLAACMQAPGVEGAVLGLPCLLWGAPGVGKTSRINKVAKKLGFYNKDLTVLASVRAASDFLGLPIPSDDTIEIEGAQVPSLKFAPPVWAVEAAKHAANTGDPNDEKAVVFFDEFTTAGPKVMAAMLRVIHERVVGEFTLPSNVVVVAAANPPAMSPGGIDLKPPVANRFVHLYWTPPTARQWADWLTGVKPSATEAVDQGKASDDEYLTLDIEKFYDELGIIKQAFAEWVMTQQGRQYLFKMPDNDDRENLKMYFDEHPDRSVAPQGDIEGLTYDARFTDIYAWPSPRSLEIACRARAAIRATRGIPVMKQSMLENELVCGTIGSQACMSINDFIRDESRRLVGPELFLTDKKAREVFFRGAPNDATQGIMLSRIVTYITNEPSEDVAPLVGNFPVVFGSFGGEGIQAEFTPMKAAMMQQAMRSVETWAASPQGREVMARDPAKAKQISIMAANTKQLFQTLKGA